MKSKFLVVLGVLTLSIAILYLARDSSDHPLEAEIGRNEVKPASEKDKNTRSSPGRDRELRKATVHSRKTKEDFMRQIEHVKPGEGVDFIIQVIDHFGQDSEEANQIVRTFFRTNGARLPPHEIVDIYEAIGDEGLQGVMPPTVAEAFLRDDVDLNQAIKIGNLMPYKRIGHCSLYMQNLFMHQILSSKSINLIVDYLPELKAGEQRVGAIRGFVAAIRNNLLQRVDNPEKLLQQINNLDLTESELKLVMDEIHNSEEAE